MKSKLFSIRIQAGLIAVLLLFSAIVGGRPQIQFAQADDEAKLKKLPPANYIRSRDFDMRHTALDLRFDWDNEQVFGTATLTLAPLVENFRTVKLDAGLMTINSVRLDGKDVTFNYDEEKTELAVDLGREVPIGDPLTLVVDYRTKGVAVANSLSFGGGGGIKFYKPTPEYPNQRKQIWSQGETEYNRYWFPSYDSPNDFATSELTATVEKPLMVISNGRLVSIVDDNRGMTTTYHWKIDTPHANYLTSIVVGEYAEVKGTYRGIPVSSYVFPNELAEGTATTKKLPDMVRFFSEKTGVNYPYEKYAQTMATGFNGGMENISATTMTNGMIHDERELLDQDSEGLQSHELAHQWFGDYVTTREWAHIWLNESFATYFQALWTEKSKGHDDFLYRDVLGNQASSIATWNQGNRRPIVTRYYANKDQLFDTYAYPRGGAVLHMLHKHLGDALFFKSLNHYLTKYANQPVETGQLRIAIEEATGQSMDWFFDEWIYKMGNPHFEVAKTYDPAKKLLTVNVKQTQKIDLMNEYPQVEFFQTYVDIEIDNRIERVWIEPKAENTYTFAAETEPKLVDFDNESTLIKELKFEKGADELIFQLRNDKDVPGRLWAMKELAARWKEDSTAEAEKAKILAAIAERITGDPFWGIRRDAIQTIVPPQGVQNARRRRNQTAPEAENPQLDAATTASMTKAAADPNSLVRAAAILALGSVKEAKYADLFLNGLKDRSYGVIGASADALAKTGSDKAYAALVKLVDTDSWRDRIRMSGLQGLAVLGDKRALDLGFKYSEKSYASGVRTFGLGIVAAAGKDDPRTFPLIFGNFKTALENSDFQSIFGGFQTLIKLGDPRGQEAFDLAKEKFKGNKNLLGFVTQLEAQFQNAPEK